MAWPLQQGQGEELRSNIAPSSLSHWDIHDENLLFGRLGRISEHTLVLILKLIDFDNAAERDEEEDADTIDIEDFDDRLQLGRYRSPRGATNMGIRANVFDIGITMTRVLARDHSMDEHDCREFIQYEHLNLDNDLKRLIIRCVAFDPMNRPKLDELLGRAFNAVLTKIYRNTRHQNRETDEQIRDIIQRYIFNASSAL
ncbi:hypothetical protein F4803DRAFT_557439 [Xylaria telfairii]|nr:hypothetical protein F4803DRAFT_557439 [Xylaria telfairii]